jgi:HEAT repeat protein
VPELVQALKGRYAETRREAAEELVARGPQARAAVPALIEALRDPDFAVRYFAAEALGSIGPTAEAAIPALLAAHYGGASALARIGPPAVPALRKALRDPKPGVRKTAAEALRDIGPPAREALPELSAALKDEAYSVRLEAAKALWTVGRQVHPAVAVFADFKADEEDRYHAVAALGSILQEAARSSRPRDPAVREAIASRARAVKDKDNWIRAAAVEALGRAGPEARGALAEAQRSEDPVVRFLAGRALARANPAGATAVFAPLLKDASATVRALTADELRRLGPRAKSAVPALRQALMDPDEDVRESAAEALRVIEPQTETRPGMP